MAKAGAKPPVDFPTEGDPGTPFLNARNREGQASSISVSGLQARGSGWGEWQERDARKKRAAAAAYGVADAAQAGLGALGQAHAQGRADIASGLGAGLGATLGGAASPTGGALAGQLRATGGAQGLAMGQLGAQHAMQMTEAQQNAEAQKLEAERFIAGMGYGFEEKQASIAKHLTDLNGIVNSGANISREVKYAQAMALLSEEQDPEVRAQIITIIEQMFGSGPGSTDPRYGSNVLYGLPQR
jgi:hypothetical protein